MAAAHPEQQAGHERADREGAGAAGGEPREAAGSALWRTTSPNTCDARAPSATRMFISRRRRDTP